MTLDISRAPASVRAGLPKRVKVVKKPVDPKAPKPLTIEEKRLLPQFFSELFLNRPQYKWCHEVLAALAPHGSRVALRASNGSGKTSEVVVVAVLWHMIRFPGSQTVLTAGVYRQLAEVLWPVLRNRITGMGPEIAQFFDVTENRIIYRSPSLPGEGPREPSLCNAFSADKPESAEGWHARGPSQNLLYIIDEAKAVSDPIFGSAERCQPTRQLVVSSPGGRAGRFFEIFNKPDPRYKLFKVSAHDCAHIEKKWIDEQIAAYGINSPIIQSMIFAEFGDEEGANLIVPPAVLQRNLASPPPKIGRQLKCGVDFAVGGDETVACLMEGNYVKDVFRNREKDSMATCGLLITFFKRHDLRPEQIWVDAGGVGSVMADALREAGWPVNRVGFGDAAYDSDKFSNRGTEMAVQLARMIETGKIIVPADDEVLHRQLTTRHLEYNSKGKLIAEPKDRMRKRGLSSPDRADALVLAACGGGVSAEEYMQRNGGRASFDDIVDEFGVGTISGAWAG